MGKFTAQDDPSLDQRIENHMQTIVAAVLSRVEPVAIILRGSFGRGEGSVFLQGGKIQFLSDYEIDVATFSPGYRSFFKRLSRQLTVDLGAETSLRWVRPDFLVKQRIGPLLMGAAPISISLYESRYGSLVLWGDDFIHTSVEIDPRQIELASGIYLLLNRMAESMLYRENAAKSEGAGVELYYWLNKTILACAEALLLLWGQYHYSYRERGRRFADLAGQKLNFLPDRGASLMELVERATQYKLNPVSELYSEPVEDLWQAVIPVVDLVFLHLTEQILKIVPSKYECFPALYLQCVEDRTHGSSPVQLLTMRLLEGYRALRARSLPFALLGSTEAAQIVYAMVPLVFHSQASKENHAVLLAARQWMKRLGPLESPKNDPVVERNYLRQQLAHYWKIYCYG